MYPRRFFHDRMPSCTQCSSAFDILPEDSAFYTQIDVPVPRMCPDCRLQRRLCERNTRSLYYRKCDLSGRQIVSQHHSSQPFPVYGLDEWLSDRWDPLSYGRAFDFSRSFFEQFKELLSAVPHMALFNTPGTMENSDYNNCTGYLKNCYLLSESDLCEDCEYSNLLKKSKDVVDCSVCYSCEQCYECVDCVDCQTLRYSQDCKQCADSWFLKDCHNCRDCIGCMNQRNKQYMIANVQYSKDEYERLKDQSALNTRSGIESVAKTCLAFFSTQPHRALLIENGENVSGDRIYTSRNAYRCFDVQDVEDCRYCQRISLTCKSCMDFNSWGQQSELVYQCSATGDRVYNSKFCSTCITVANAEYCFECIHCSDIFGCVGLKNKKFCIFNVQYSEQEYRALRGKIVAHMKASCEYGEYFPMELCAFAYNETFAPDLFPMTKEDVLARGWRWKDEESTGERYIGKEIVLPDDVAPVKDDLCEQILLCRETKKPYRIIKQELAFYRKMDLPVPVLCPDERHRRRVAKRNPYTLLKRACGKCGKQTQTTLTDMRAKIVFCEKCYLDTVY